MAGLARWVVLMDQVAPRHRAGHCSHAEGASGDSYGTALPCLSARGTGGYTQGNR